MAKRILIIDDEENIRHVTRLTLEVAGYEVGEACDSVRGLEAFGDGATLGSRAVGSEDARHGRPRNAPAD